MTIDLLRLLTLFIDMIQKPAFGQWSNPCLPLVMDFLLDLLIIKSTLLLEENRLGLSVLNVNEVFFASQQQLDNIIKKRLRKGEETR